MKEPAFFEYPLPLVDPDLCDGCGLCVLVCPNEALALIKGNLVVTHATACDYEGYCEGICPNQAITRFFQIVSTSE